MILQLNPTVAACIMQYQQKHWRWATLYTGLHAAQAGTAVSQCGPQNSFEAMYAEAAVCNALGVITKC